MVGIEGFLLSVRGDNPLYVSALGYIPVSRQHLGKVEAGQELVTKEIVIKLH